MKKLGVGIIGWGVMGRTHAASYQRTAGCQVRAVASRTAGGVAGNLGSMGGEVSLPSSVRRHEEAEALFADPAIDIVSICTHTDSHVPLAIAALEAGKHVLVEKPVSLDPLEIERLAAVAARTGLLCMPAMCMRFWPGWPWLREHVRLGTYGEVLSARFERMGAPPAWSADFYRDTARSGGALFDLHIHDVDFMLWCFGPPQAVRATGSIDHVMAWYEYRKGSAPVQIEGAWVPIEAFPFRMCYRVLFEDAVAEFRHDARTPLVVRERGRTTAIPLAGDSAYEAQVRHFVNAVRTGRTELRATLADAAAATRLIQAEHAQLEGLPARPGLA